MEANVRIHPTATVEAGVTIGRDTSIWDFAHVRHSTTIGQECIVGGKTYIAYGVTIGDRVKLNSFVYVCTDVTIETGVMVSAGVVFTNDRFPRATTPDLARLHSSDPDDNTLATRVCAGATIGAQATIGPGLTIGRFAMVGMGSVVTRDVPDYGLIYGNPAKVVGYVCACGQPLVPSGDDGDSAVQSCLRCGCRYAHNGLALRELTAAR